MVNIKENIGDINHQLFLGHLRGSHKWVWKAALLLHERGYYVQIPPITYSNDVEDWEDHVDDGDLYISKKNLITLPRVEPWWTPVAHRIEVKHLSAEFTCASDFQYKRNSSSTTCTLADVRCSI